MYDDTTLGPPEQRLWLYEKYDYTILSAGDVLTNVINTGELHNGKYYMRYDGRITQDQKIDWSSPWIFGRRSPERNCLLWHRIMFGIFGMLPIWCRLNCWKVIVRPRTLEELFMLKELQESLRLPSKLGMETRVRVFGNWGGYFYCNSFEEGCDRLDQVRKEVASFISPKIPVYLKLACTEFEHRFGPTDQYRVPTKEDHKNEDTIRGCFNEDCSQFAQPDHLKDHIGQRWIHFAWDRGDPTAHKFNQGKPLFPPCVTYERPVEPETPEEKPEQKAKGKGRRKKT